MKSLLGLTTYTMSRQWCGLHSEKKAGPGRQPQRGVWVAEPKIRRGVCGEAAHQEGYLAFISFKFPAKALYAGLCSRRHVLPASLFDASNVATPVPPGLRAKPRV